METQLENHNHTIAQLLRQLSDDDGMNRLHAREKLVAEGRLATHQLMTLLSSHRKQLRWEAAKVLAEIGDPESVPALIPALEDPEWGVRWLAAEALAHIGRPALLPLLNLLEDRPDNLDVRDGVHHVLHDLRDPQDRDLVAPVFRELSRCGDNLDLFLATQKVARVLT